MLIYKLDQQIEDLLASFIDPETGELTCTEEEMQAKIMALQMDYARLIHNLRNECINRTAEAEALKAEKANLDKRKRVAENAADRAKRWLAYLTNGEKYSDGVVKITYRKSEQLAIDDRESLLAWAIDHNKFLKEPELRDGDIKQAIKNGEDVPYAHIEERSNIQVK